MPRETAGREWDGAPGSPCSVPRRLLPCVPAPRCDRIPPPKVMMAQARKFGWFAGVFTPSILTILGVIMYLRLPSIIGQAGMMETIGIILLAHVISVSTGLSVASIATDKKVEAGGTYYMISRSLGLPIGGTLGLALFLGLSFSVSLYVIGFSESFLSYWGFDVTKDMIRVAGSVTLLVVTVVTFLSTSLALKTQFYIMAAIALSLISVLTGSHEHVPTATATVAVVQTTPFIVLFGIFFPAVTGFEAGVSMSGDLKDPKKAIPVGTILAIVVGLVVYIALTTFLARTVSAESLRDDPAILLKISRFPALVIAGVWGATISSALGSILGAPRILQATAVDRITPRFFGKGFGPSNEPRNALFVTFAIAEVGILIGELDLIARIVSMFFITTYGFLNLSCAIERWASPDFRPEFKVPGWVSLVGSAACFVVMIQLDLLAMLGASLVLGILYFVLARRQLTLSSGDTWEGVWSSVSRIALSRLVERQSHQRNWRPNIILFAGSAERRGHLRRLGDWLAYKRGLVSNVELVPHPAEERASRPVGVETQNPRVGFFTHRVACEDVYTGMVDVARLHGFAGVQPNTALVGWPRHNRAPDRFHRALDAMVDMDLNLLVLDHDARYDYGTFGDIDVWLEGGGRNASLALALIRFLSSADPWRRASVRFLKWHEGESAFAGALRDSLQGVIDAQRLVASVEVVQATPGETFAEAVRRVSGAADLTLIGLPKAGRLSSEGFVHQTNEIIDTIGTVLLLRASSSFEELSLGAFTEEARVLPDGSAEAVDIDATDLVGDDSVLRDEVERLQVILRASASELQRELAVAEGLGAALVTETADLVRGAFSNLERSLLGADRPRRSRVLDRETAHLLFRGREILSGARGETLESQARALSSAIGLTARTLENLPAKLPVRTGAGQGEVRRGVRLRSSFEGDLLPDLLEHLAETVRRFDRRTAARVDAAVRLQAALADSLDRMALELDCSEPEARAVLERERESLEALDRTLLGSLDQDRGASLAAVRTGVSESLSSWVRALTGDRGGAGRRAGGRSQELLHRLRDVGAAWHTHQRLRLSDAELQVRLRGARHRMEVVLDRAIQDVRIDVDTTLRGLKAMEILVAQRGQSPDPGDALARPDVSTGLDGEAVVKALVDELRGALEDVPEEWDVALDLGGSASLDVLEPVDIRRIAPRATVDYRLQTTLVTPLEPKLLGLGAACARGVETANDVSRLVRYASTEEVQPGMEGSLRSILTRGASRLREATERIAEALESVSDSAAAGLRGVEPHLVASAVAAEGVGNARRPGVGTPWLRSADQLVSRGRSAVARRLVGVWYRRSRGVILSERLRAGERAGRTGVDRLLSLVEAVSPETGVVSDLPFYYRQLFLEHAVATRDFWVLRPRAEAQVDRALARFQRGHEGGLLITGDPGSGRSSLVARLAQRQVRSQVLRVVPPPHATAKLATFEDHLRHALGSDGDVEATLAQLPIGTMVVVDDLDLWWERHGGGLEVVERLLGLIDRFGGRCLFVVSVTTVGERLLRRLVRFEERFLGSIHLEPFSAEALRDIVLIRHRSTGMGLTVDGRPTHGLADWRMARFFNQLFDRTHGNVGESLQSWIASITLLEQDAVHVETVETPRLGALRDLLPQQRALLATLMVHRRVSPDGVRRTMEVEPQELDAEIAALRRCGMVEEAGGALRLSRYMEPDLRRDLQTRGVL